MTLEISVVCSKCGVLGTSTQRSERAATELREYLSKCGWKAGNGGPDLCPQCVALAPVPPVVTSDE